MKKLFALILVVCMTASFAAAETDLSSMSFSNLLALQKEIVAEIMSRPEWKEVTVPAGTWIVGQDIPAGSYCMKPAGKGKVNITVWKKAVHDYSNNGLIYNELISQDSPYGKMTLQDGQIIEFGSAIIFAPPASLGF